MQVKLWRDSEAFLAHFRVTYAYSALNTGIPRNCANTLTGACATVSRRRFESHFIETDLAVPIPAILSSAACQYSRAATSLN